MNNKLSVSTKNNILLSIMAVIIAIILLFPLYWIFVTSLKSEAEIFRIPPTIIPHKISLESYLVQLNHGDFNMFNSFANSLKIAMGSMIISVILSVPASYAIAKYNFKGIRLVILGFLITQMLPVSVILIPMFLILRNIGLYNTQLAVIFADATIGIPFSVLILKNYFASIPRELEEAAYIDGCNHFTAFLKILVPIAKPGIVVCAIFSFLYAWGDLAYGMTFIQDQQLRPITAGIFNFMGQYGTQWSYLTAFAVVTIIPVALIFIFMQRFIISGLTSGAVKG